MELKSLQKLNKNIYEGELLYNNVVYCFTYTPENDSITTYLQYYYIKQSNQVKTYNTVVNDNLFTLYNKPIKRLISDSIKNSNYLS